MPEVAIIGDTHVPSRAGSIPDWVRERVREADETIHVGDFDDPEVLAEVADLADGLTAVRGNMDPAGVDLPAVETLDVDGVRFVVTHGTGSPAGWADRVAGTVREHADPERTNVGAAGHTHQVVDLAHDGTRLLNPGSATGARPADGASMLTVGVADGELDVEVHRE